MSKAALPIYSRERDVRCSCYDLEDFGDSRRRVLLGILAGATLARQCGIERVGVYHRVVAALMGDKGSLRCPAGNSMGRVGVVINIRATSELATRPTGDHSDNSATSPDSSFQAQRKNSTVCLYFWAAEERNNIVTSPIIKAPTELPRPCYLSVISGDWSLEAHVAVARSFAVNMLWSPQGAL